MLVTPSICSNSVRLQVCIVISSLTKRLFSGPPTDYWWRQPSGNDEGLSWLKQHNFIIFWFILTKLSSKVYISYCWNINKSRMGYFLYSPCTCTCRCGAVLCTPWRSTFCRATFSGCSAKDFTYTRSLCTRSALASDCSTLVLSLAGVSHHLEPLSLVLLS